MLPRKKTKYVSLEEAEEKLRQYCAYQERCHQEVRYKLLQLGIRGEELERVIVTLVEEGFLDEERFARSYARGKLVNNQWGRRKIMQHLQQKDISDYNLRKAENELHAAGYEEVLGQLLVKKAKTLSRYTGLEVRQKLFRYAWQKGFETPLINKVLDRLC